MAQRLPGNKRERVKDLRMERGLSLSELASRVGCNETTLGRYERGETDRIGDEIVRSLAREFNVSIDYLMHLTTIFCAKWQNFCVENTPMPMLVSAQGF